MELGKNYEASEEVEGWWKKNRRQIPGVKASEEAHLSLSD